MLVKPEKQIKRHITIHEIKRPMMFTKISRKSEDREYKGYPKEHVTGLLVWHRCRIPPHCICTSTPN